MWCHRIWKEYCDTINFGKNLAVKTISHRGKNVNFFLWTIKNSPAEGSQNIIKLASWADNT